jgi:hypothetical protein
MGCVAWGLMGGESRGCADPQPSELGGNVVEAQLLALRVLRDMLEPVPHITRTPSVNKVKSAQSCTEESAQAECEPCAADHALAKERAIAVGRQMTCATRDDAHATVETNARRCSGEGVQSVSGGQEYCGECVHCVSRGIVTSIACGPMGCAAWGPMGCEA